MTEYWVSGKTYHCIYCKIFIADNAPSRRQHENGDRHKNNKNRFVHGLYKQNERKKKDLEEEKLEMARIDQAANAAYARDLSMGNVSIASSSKSKIISSTPSGPSSSKPSRPSSVFENYSTAQSLGYTDPDAERIQMELDRRRAEGTVGEWQTVVPPPPPLPEGSQEANDNVTALSAKRPLEIEDTGDGPQFKVRKRVLPTTSDFWDPDSVPIKLKSEKVEEEAKIEFNDVSVPLLRADSAEGTSVNPVDAKNKPKWTSVGWGKSNSLGGSQPEEPRSDVTAEQLDLSRPSSKSMQNTDSSSIKVEEADGICRQPTDDKQQATSEPSFVPVEILIEHRVEAKKEDQDAAESTATKSLFRKRKALTGNSSKR